MKEIKPQPEPTPFQAIMYLFKRAVDDGIISKEEAFQVLTVVIPDLVINAGLRAFRGRLESLKANLLARLPGKKN